MSEMAAGEGTPTEKRLLKMLKDVIERYDELKGRDATNHEFACCMYSAEDVVAEADPNYRRKL